MHEALTAHLWWEKGQLGRWVNRRCASVGLNHHVELVAGAVADAEIARMAEAERERDRKR